MHIERAHMEEDAGKSLHQGEFTLINLNRAGVPLLEIVSGPRCRRLHKRPNMRERFEKFCVTRMFATAISKKAPCAAIAMSAFVKKAKRNSAHKVELKNINSFRFIEKAIEYEIQRQIDCIEAGETIVQETRL